jgi:5'-nucleotidase
MKPLILATNDDGVAASGLRALVEAVTGLGDVVVCAPAEERSGSSHAITFHTHLRAEPVREGWWRVSGTPVDCVYLAMHHLCGRFPDLVVSGVNAGYNLGSDVFYSGTVGAAAEAYLRGVSSIAVSAERGSDPAYAMGVVRRLAASMLAGGRPHLLNVNVPPLGDALPIVEVTRLGARKYVDSVESRTDPQGRPYYWIGGPPTRGDDREGDDTFAVHHGRISVTPLEMDITAADLDPVRRMLENEP